MAEDQADKLWDELTETSYERRYTKEKLPKIADFDTYKDELERRIYKQVQYEALSSDEQRWALNLCESTFYGEALSIFRRENDWYFPTNKPNKHQALVIKVCERLFPYEARQRGYLLNDNKIAPQLIAIMKGINAEWAEQVAETGFQEREDIQETIRELEGKDEELFPEPEPIRVEVAGAILNFSTWDTALVVYVDCSQRGKEVVAVYTDKDWSFEFKAQVIERSVGGTIICAAIFTRIPLVTDKLRNLQKVVKRVDCTIRFATIQETVTLFRENVAELDLRGRRV